MEEGGTFRDWLSERVGTGPGQVSRRELARRLADAAPGDGDIDSYRSSLRRILRGERVATQRTRDSIQDALGDHTAPKVDDEDEPLTREMVVAGLERMQRELRQFKSAFVDGGI